MIISGKLNQDWPWVREKIEDIRTRYDVEWLAEDVYCQIKVGNCSLYVNENRNSFAIIRPIKDPYTGEHGVELVNIFIAVGESRELLEHELFDMLKKAGTKFMQADSKRVGLQRIGWDTEKIVYRRRL